MDLNLESPESTHTSDEEDEEDETVNTKMPSMRIMKLKLVKLKLESIESEESEESDESIDSAESMETEESDVSDDATDSETAEDYVQTLMDALKEKYEVKKKLVNRSLQNTMQTLQGHFSIRILCHRKSTNSEMSEIIDSFGDSETDDKECHPVMHENFIIFLMRELRAKESDPLLKFAEIFVLTSGNSYNLIAKEDRDEEFPRRIARRVLEFNLRSLSSKQLTGPTTSTAQTYREGEGKGLTFWDYLGQITTSYKMPLRSDSCLYRLHCFKTKAGKLKNVSVTVGQDYLRFHQRMSLKDIAALLLQLSRISRGQKTLKHSTSKREIDNADFDMFDHVTIMKAKRIVKKQNKMLQKRLQRCLKKKQKVGMLLSHKQLHSWHEANEFSLQAKSSEKRKYDTINVWHGSPPSIEAILNVIRKQPKVYTFDSLFLQFQDTSKDRPEKIRDSLLMFVEGHFVTQYGMSLFRHCGQWLKIENEYMTHLEKEFNDIVVDFSLDSNRILPLPWPFSGVDAPRRIKVKNKSSNKRPSFPSTIYDFKKWYRELYDRTKNWDLKDIPTEDVFFDKYPKAEAKISKNALQLFKRLHCQQSEEHYNEGYIWHDLILDDEQSGYLLGDRIFIKNVELYDILYYTRNKTYLIHVKEGFGNKTRDVCSQIRVSAELVFRDLICHNNFDIIKELWKTITKYEGNRDEKEYKYRCKVRDCYMELTKNTFIKLFRKNDIVFVLAFRDSRKFVKQAVPFVVYPEETLKKAFGADVKSVTKKLFRCKYLKKSGEQIIITDRVIGTTLKEAEQEINLKTAAKSREAFRILQQTLSGNKSFIAKMEVVHLFSHFKRFRTSSRSMSLKLCSIGKTRPVY